MSHFIFDCDDVLLNWIGSFTVFLSKRGYAPNSKGPDSWDMSYWIGCTPEEARQLIVDFNASDNFSKLPAVDGAFETVWHLYDAGHTLSILTAFGDSEQAKTDREENLRRAFTRDDQYPFLFTKGLPLGASKMAALGDYAKAPIMESFVFIEDNYTHAESGIANGIKSFCVRRPHNRSAERDNPDSRVIWIDKVRDLQYVYPSRIAA